MLITGGKILFTEGENVNVERLHGMSLIMTVQDH